MMNDLFIKDYEEDSYDLNDLSKQLDEYNNKPLDRGLESTREVKKNIKDIDKNTKETKYNSTREFLLSLKKGDVIMNSKREILIFNEIIEQKEDGGISFTCDKPLCKNEDRIICSHKILDDKLKYFRVSDEKYKEHINNFTDMSERKIKASTNKRNPGEYETSSELSNVQCHICNSFLQLKTLDYVRGHMHKLEGTEYEGLVTCYRCQQNEFVDLYKGKTGRHEDKEDSIYSNQKVDVKKKTTQSKVKNKETKSKRVTKKDLEEMLKVRDKAIKELKESLNAKDKEIKKLKDNLNAKDKEIKELKDKLKNKETSDDKLNKLLDKKSKSGFKFEIIKY